MTVYRVLKGIDYPGKDGSDVRREPGETAGDIPDDAVAGLLRQGAVEPAPEPKPRPKPKG